ncbi:hypothetical protein C8J57DRAFT_1497764 [Mycena rebaudengoi]|nr:hypothetical protein C8J57DRAFT_1497764 [Mycena rebaudengoi]
MFATTYYTDDVRARYLSSLTRVRQAEAEYVAYLAQQDRARLRDAQRRHQQAVAVRRIQQEVLLRLAVQQVQQRTLVLQQPAPPAPAPKHLVVPLVSSRTARGVPYEKSQEPATPERVQNALTRHLASETDPEVHATIQQLLSTLSASSSSSSTEAVRAALERRLARERNPEVHSTIRLPPRAPRTHQFQFHSHSFPKHSQSPRRDPDARARPPHARRGTLSFPSSAPSSSDALPPTPRNAPVRQYAHALNGLLARLDAVDSAGDETVRVRRRAVVGRVEAALGEVERVVEGRWKLFGMGSASAPASSSSPRPTRPVSPVAAVLDSLEGAQAAEGPSSVAAFRRERTSSISFGGAGPGFCGSRASKILHSGMLSRCAATETHFHLLHLHQRIRSTTRNQHRNLQPSSEQETVSPILNAYVDEASANEPAQSSRSTAVVQDASLDAAVPVSRMRGILRIHSPRAESEAGPSAVVVVGDSAHLPTEDTTQDSDLDSDSRRKEQEPLSLSVVAGVHEEAVVVEEEDEHEDTTQDSGLDSELEEQEQEPLSLSVVAGVHEEAVIVEVEEDEHEFIDAEDEDADSASSWSEVDA